MAIVLTKYNDSFDIEVVKGKETKFRLYGAVLEPTVAGWTFRVRNLSSAITPIRELRIDSVDLDANFFFLPLPTPVTLFDIPSLLK